MGFHLFHGEYEGPAITHLEGFQIQGKEGSYVEDKCDEVGMKYWKSNQWPRTKPLQTF